MRIPLQGTSTSTSPPLQRRPVPSATTPRPQNESTAAGIDDAASRMGNPATNWSEALTGSAITNNPSTPSDRRDHISVRPIAATATAARKIGVANTHARPYTATIAVEIIGSLALDSDRRHANQIAVASAASPHAASGSPAMRRAHQIQTGQKAAHSSARIVS